MPEAISRRRFLSVSATVPVGLALGVGTTSLGMLQAPAFAAAPAAATAQALKPLTDADPRVAALGFVSNAAKAKGDPMYKAGSNCGNCSQLKGKVGDKLRPCALYPDLTNPQQLLLVPVDGWCRSWMAIPKS